MTAEPDRTREMRELPHQERNRRIALGVLSREVVDGRKRFWANRTEGFLGEVKG